MFEHDDESVQFPTEELSEDIWQRTLSNAFVFESTLSEGVVPEDLGLVDATAADSFTHNETSDINAALETLPEKAPKAFVLMHVAGVCALQRDQCGFFSWVGERESHFLRPNFLLAHGLDNVETRC